MQRWCLLYIFVLCHVFLPFFLITKLLSQTFSDDLPCNSIAYNFNSCFVNGKTEIKISHVDKCSRFQCCIKVNDSRYKQCEVTPHFSTGPNLLKKNIVLRKDTIEKSFLIDPLTTNNAIYHDLLILKTHSHV